ncbi:MAG: flagellar protein FliT [Lachnospiraceae bacterium]|nr:flagellar protein FliT [Lachnospiraceae bacterium]
MDKQYIQMMLESLQKKEQILKELIKKSNDQKDVLSAETVDWDAFDNITVDKGELIDELLKLDEGFESLFERVKGPLTEHKDMYKTEIGFMQATIRSLTEKSTELEALEQRNKTMVETRVAESRQSIKQSKLGSQAAIEYYQRMNKLNVVDPQLMDKKI